MDETTTEQVLEQKIEETSEVNIRYKKLNKRLLYLLSGELGYFILIIIYVIIFTIIPQYSGRLSSSGPFSGLGGLFPWFLLPMFIAFAGNLFGGVASLFLTIKKDQEGFPGTGHLLNWMFIMTTCWIFILLLMTILPSSMRGID